MTLPELCLRRPVLASVASLLIVVIGLVSLSRLPVRELPDVDSATVTITTGYFGAAPEIVDTQITELIESAVSGVSGIDRMDSSSSRGRSRVVVDFDPSVDIDQAANDVRSAVSAVAGDLPSEADEPVVVKNDSNAEPVIRVGLTSDRHQPPELTDYAERFVVDRISTLPGIAQVDILGDRRYAMRVDLDPEAMAARQLTATEIADALRRNNLELPAGDVVSTSRRFQVRAAARLSTPEAFADVVVSVVDGTPVRLGEVARVHVGSENDDTIVRSEGRNAVTLNVLRQSQSNTIAISDAVQREMALIRPGLPDGMEIFIGSDDAIFIRRSISEVLQTLAIAVALVVAVIFVFLGSPRATLAPAVTIPVALIGALAGIQALGFSLNILTLFALILAIGIVVDDAIVVLENIQRRVSEGMPPPAAALLGSNQVVFAVIATTLTLVSVFVPISFLDGQVGRLFTEFGIVLALAVVVSTFVALTLTPVICRAVLREGSGGLLERIVNRAFRRVENGYRRLLRVALNWPVIVVAVGVAVGGAAWTINQQVPQELAPREDRGVFFVSISAPQGSTTSFTDREVREVEDRLAYLSENGEAERIFSIIGFRRLTHRAFVVARLADWDDRERHSAEIVQSLFGPMSTVPGARAFPIQPTGLGLRGSRTPLQVKILGPDFDSVREWSGQMLERLRQNPNLQNLETDYEETQPELRVDIDRALADDLGVAVEDVAATLQTFFAGREATQWIDRGREYPVILQAEEAARATADDLGAMYVRSRSSGALIPLSALLSLDEGAATPELNRFNRLPAIEISGSMVDGYSIGEAIQDVLDAAEELLPGEAQTAFDGQSREFLDTSSGALMVFLFALLIVYLVLSAQFESFLDPLPIMLTVPLGVTGALATLWAYDMSLNIYSQVGLVLLIGLMAKNGILIVEFANQLRDQGADVRTAALEGAVARLRPVLMTVVSTLLGALPLVMSSGAGAEARQAIGMVVFGGFGGASVLTLFLTPVLYDLFARLSKSRASQAQALDEALAQAEARSRSQAGARAKPSPEVTPAE